MKISWRDSFNRSKGFEVMIHNCLAEFPKNNEEKKKMEKLLKLTCGDNLNEESCESLVFTIKLFSEVINITNDQKIASQFVENISCLKYFDGDFSMQKNLAPKKISVNNENFVDCVKDLISHSHMFNRANSSLNGLNSINLDWFQTNFEIFVQRVSQQKTSVENVKEKVEKLIVTNDSVFSNLKTSDLEHSLRKYQDEKNKLLNRLKEIETEEKRLFLEISFRKQNLNQIRNDQIGKKIKPFKTIKKNSNENRERSN